MGRPTKPEGKRLKQRMQALVDRELSINEIARQTGKSAQAVQQYLSYHNMMTVEMRRRSEKNLDKVKGEVHNGEAGKETPA